MNCSNRQSSTPVQAETNSTTASNPASSPPAEKTTTPESVPNLEARVAEHEKRLAAVEAQLARLAATTSGAPQAQPQSNRKLSQDNAEKAIKAFASTHRLGPIIGAGATCSFNVQSIASIEPVSQFSDTEATSIVTIPCGNSLAFKVVFQKDIDNRWFLTKLEQVQGRGWYNQYEADWIRQAHNLKVPAQ
jgi:hypothetical protein